MRSKTRLLRPNQASQFLFGPRGTGKSSWIQTTYPQALHLDLLRPELVRQLSAHPERLVELIDGSPARQPVVVDEVQRLPELLAVVHRLIEARPNLQFVLTGSSARKIRRTGVDLLGGRAQLRFMHPFLAVELGEDFNLHDALTLGMVPLVLASADPAATLSAYVALYVQEEVRAEGLVRNLDAFHRFLEAISFAHGTVLNLSNVASECGVERSTAANYLEILDDLLLAFRLPAFTRRARRDTVQKSKFYLFDVGVYRSLRPSGPLDRPEEIAGPAVEGLVLQHLRAWIDYRRDRHELFYWRTRGGSEVDAIVYGDTGLFAIEVTSARTLRPQDFRGLRAFREDYPESTPILLYGGSERLRRQDILCLPIEAFLRQLDPNAELLPEA